MKNKNSSWTFSFGKFGATEVKLHLSLMLFISWIFFERSRELPDLKAKILLVSIFTLSLVLHETVHLLVARIVNIKAGESIVYPFGADIKTDLKLSHWQELSIYCAGPLINLCVAICCALLSDIDLTVPLSLHVGLVTRIYYINLIIGLVNLIPAAPLDGARILAAIFGTLKVNNARQLAMSISQFFAIAFAIAMLFTANVLAMIAGAVVLVRALSDHLYSRIRSAALGLKVSDVMTAAAHLAILEHGMTVSQSVRLALKSFQPAFPVMYAGQLIGLIERQELLELSATYGADSYISGHVKRDVYKLSPDQSVENLIDIISATGIEIFVVAIEAELKGLLTKDRLLEFLVVQELHKRAVETENFLDQEF